MIKENMRICDICSQEIIKEKKYCRSTIPRGKAALFEATLKAKSDVELPTWTENKDGTITLDICLECHINMGDFALPEYIH